MIKLQPSTGSFFISNKTKCWDHYRCLQRLQRFKMAHFKYIMCVCWFCCICCSLSSSQNTNYPWNKSESCQEHPCVINASIMYSNRPVFIFVTIVAIPNKLCNTARPNHPLESLWTLGSTAKICLQSRLMLAWKGKCISKVTGQLVDSSCLTVTISNCISIRVFKTSWMSTLRVTLESVWYMLLMLWFPWHI